MSENNVELDDKIILIDEEGQELEFQIVDVMEFEGSFYAVLLPWEEKEDESAIVFKVKKENDEDVLYEIEDDDEWERVVEYWNSTVED